MVPGLEFDCDLLMEAFISHTGLLQDRKRTEVEAVAEDVEVEVPCLTLVFMRKNE